MEDLNSRVEALVTEKMDNSEAFTIVDISHPLIAEDNSVRHSEVKKAVEDLLFNALSPTFCDLLEMHDYMVTSIRVQPEPGKWVSARLFYPSEKDPAEYSNVSQELKRNTSVISITDRLPTELL